MFIPGIVASMVNTVAGGPPEPFYATVTAVTITLGMQINISHDCDVDWGDGNFVPETAGLVSIATVLGTNIIIKSDNNVTSILFDRLFTQNFKIIDIINSSTLTTCLNMCSSCTTLESFTMADASNVLSFNNAFSWCAALTTFTITNLDASACIDFTSFFYSCTNLATMPAISMSSAITMVQTWRGCTSLTTMPLLDISSTQGVGVKTLENAWDGCTSLTSFPLIDFSTYTNFNRTFKGTAIASLPAINTVSGLQFAGMFENCTSLVCLSTLNTSNATVNPASLFSNTPLLVAPNGTEQTSLATVPPGLDYTNGSACP